MMSIWRAELAKVRSARISTGSAWRLSEVKNFSASTRRLGQSTRWSGFFGNQMLNSSIGLALIVMPDLAVP